MTRLAPARTLALAQEEDRAKIYRLRHRIYARELRQHPENAEGSLHDSLDAINSYIVIRRQGGISGFISITPPDHRRYSIDKYISRKYLPFPCDDGLFEVRLLTVIEAHRGGSASLLLMYAALRWIEEHGGDRIVAIGRDKVAGMYERLGLARTGIQFQSGAVTYELMTAPLPALQERAKALRERIARAGDRVEWRMEYPFERTAACDHGGSSFAKIGDEFQTLERRHEVINADVLDAWFPPAPAVVDALKQDPAWTARSSPPNHAEGLIRAIARTRDLPTESIVVGAGSSDLIFRSFQRWLNPRSRVLILDPMYGEYAHVLERVIGCRVDRLLLERKNGYRLEPSRLSVRFDAPWDLIVLVNPNNPTGRHVPRRKLEEVLTSIPDRTRIWIDEAYIEYVGSEQSLERFAARSTNVIVCKSMSKVYALSGLRCAYLCAPAPIAADLRRITPPWPVSLPAQMAGVLALRNPDYYRQRYEETRALRDRLAETLKDWEGMEVLNGHLNSLLLHLPSWSPDAATIVRGCRNRNLFLREFSSLSARLGNRTLRIAVKDADTNRRMVRILLEVLAR